MDVTIIRLAAVSVVAAHGVGHLLGLLPALGVASLAGMSGQSWLLDGLIGPGGSRAVAATLFLVPAVGFVVAAAGILLGVPWWRSVAVAAAGVSLMATALFPQAYGTGSTVGAVAVNLVVLYGVIVAGWGNDAALA